MNKLFLFISALMMSILPASAATRAVNTSGNDIFWIILTIALTLYFAKRGIETGLLRNPISLAILIICLIIIYIVVQAIFMVIGIGEAIDNSIQGTANIMINLTEKI